MEKVAHSYKVFDNFIEIIPSDEIQDNFVYEIKIKGLKALNQSKKLDNLAVKITTKLTPSYCTIDGLDPLIDVFGISEDKLLYYIREASRYADYVNKSSAVREGRDIPFQVEQFVKTKATIDALLKAYMVKASQSGTKGTLGDISFESSNKLDGINDLIKSLKDELKKWEDAIRGYYNEGRAKPVATKIGIKAASNSSIPVTTVDNILSDFTRNRASEG